ncbi:MAG: hypothetical protein RL177_972, partial [Bacteroidota bacterium]
MGILRIIGTESGNSGKKKFAYLASNCINFAELHRGMSSA